MAKGDSSSDEEYMGEFGSNAQSYLSQGQKVVCDCSACVSTGIRRKVSKSTRSRHRRKYSQSVPKNVRKSPSRRTSRIKIQRSTAKSVDASSVCQSAKEAVALPKPTGYLLDNGYATADPLKALDHRNGDHSIDIETDPVEVITVDFFRNILGVLRSEFCA